MLFTLNKLSKGSAALDEAYSEAINFTIRNRTIVQWICMKEHVQDLNEFSADIILLPFHTSNIMQIYRGIYELYLLITNEA
jgi:hypothetical protein